MDDNTTSTLIGRNPESYAVSGKIMLSSIAIMFIVVILIVCFHSYARWFFHRTTHHRHPPRSTHRRANHLIFQSDPTTTTNPLQGLDPSILKSLPTFLYSSTTHDPSLECAVCLSEFQKNEQGRLLPMCNHSFHIECIDMWFLSHSNCPLCRALIRPDISFSTSEKTVEMVVSVREPENPEAESSSGSYPLRQRDEDEMGSSSSSPPVALLPLQLVGISVEVPRRNESFRDLGSPGGHHEF